MDDIQTELIDSLRSKLNRTLVGLGMPEGSSFQPSLDIPKEESFGDFSSNAALLAAKALKKPPMKIAEEIVAVLRGDAELVSANGFIREINVAAPGFINFYASDYFFHRLLAQCVKEGDGFGSSPAGCGRKVLIEFVSANPTGPLSVAHARQAAVGDSLAEIIKFLGYDVKKEYYLNDAGNQINILGRSVMARMKELEGEKVEFPEDYYQGEYIKDIASGIRSSAKSDLSEKDFSDYAVKYILDIIKQELADFGTLFDNWYSQAVLERSDKISKAISNLKEKGFIFEQDGAVWFESSAFGDDKDRVIIKSDASFTYLTPDIAYHEDKFRRGFDWLINLWGPDHHGYINRIKAAVCAFGKDKDALSIIIVQLASIFRDGKQLLMSTRRGQYITLREVLDEVGKDAARFFFLMRKTSSHLDFDIDLAKKQSQENPVFYVQYAHARISGIIRNAAAGTDISKADLSRLVEKEELKLIRTIAGFKVVLQICLKALDPYPLTEYLKNVAESFHKFYDKHKVLCEDNDLSSARLALITGAKVVLVNGLRLLGVSAPEKM